MSTVYISPFVNETNDYINRVKSVVRDCGHEVVPFSFRTIFSRQALGLLRPQNVVFVHWMESRVFSEGREGAKIRPAGLLQLVIYILVLASMRARLVYFVHDHAVHDLVGWRRAFSVRLIALLRWMADVVVVHDPNFVDQYKAIYLPHPLYQERSPDSSALRKRGNVFRAGVLGAIRPYKRIEEIIDVWPEGPELFIRGRSDAAYEKLLRQHIAKRGPSAHITLNVGFMSREEFDEEVGRLDALILPHADASALVSGAFFEAVGTVPVVIARSSPFVEWAKGNFKSVLTFRDKSDLLSAIATATENREENIKLLPAAADLANKFFGQEFCRAEYEKVLRLK